MDVGVLINGAIGLIVILAILIMVFLLPAKIKGKKKETKKENQKKSEPKKEEKKKQNQLTLEEIRLITKDKNSTTEELEEAIEQLIKHHVKIPPKLGIRSHPDFDIYVEIIIYLVRHKNTNKRLVLMLDSALVKNNPSYKAQLNDALNKALTSRNG